MGKSKERKIKNRNKQKEKMNQRNEVKVACRVHISKKKHFVKIVASLVTVLLKMTLCLCIYFVLTEKPLF